MTNSQGIFCPYYAGALVPSICLAGFAPSYLANNGSIQGECATCSGIPGITLNGWSRANSTCCTSASFAAVVDVENGKFLGCAAGFVVKGDESCEACEGGTFSIGGTKRTCTTCEVTRLSPGFGSCSTLNGSVTSCIGPGFYKTPEQSCKICAEQTYSTNGISESCNKCNETNGICDPANGKTDLETQTRICPPGTYVSSESTCILCGNNTFSSISNNGSSCTSLCPSNAQCFATGGIKSCNSNAHYNHKTKSCDLNLELLSIIPTITALQIIPSATSSTTTTTLLVKVTQSAALQLGVVFNTFVSEVYNVITLIKAKTN